MKKLTVRERDWLFMRDNGHAMSEVAGRYGYGAFIGKLVELFLAAGTDDALRLMNTFTATFRFLMDRVKDERKKEKEAQEALRKKNSA